MTSGDHCALCFLRVAPYARHNGRSDRVQYVRWVFHRSCLRASGMTAEEAASSVARKRALMRASHRRHPRG